jgi:hypothetical protein
MKNQIMNKTILFVAILVFGLVSCEKDESNDNNPQTTEQKILGDWRGDKATFSSSSPAVYEENSLNEYVLRFKNDGMYDVDSLGQFTVETDVWQLLGNDRLIMGGLLENPTDTFDIITLNGNSFIIRNTSTDNVGGTVLTVEVNIFLKRPV